MSSLDRWDRFSDENLERLRGRRDLGRRGHRRRGDRAGGGRRRGGARLSHAAARGPRLRPGDVEPEHQADPRRGALPGPGGHRAGPRGAPRAGRAVPQRAAPGPSPRLRRAGLPMAGPAVLRDRAEGLRPAGRPIESRRRRAGSARPRSLARIPTIVGRGLRGGIVYTDGQFDDARLAITLARTFADLGGTALNAAPGHGLLAARRADRRGRRPGRRRPARSSRSRPASVDQRDRRLRRRDPPARRSRPTAPIPC